MKEIELNERKKLQVEILDDVVSFCEKNNLKYCLAYGTLLGAIRHKGYIPWDDDIDIHMPRPDYDRFLATYRSEKEHYQVLDHSITKDYTIPFAKVHDTRTIVIEGLYNKNEYGIYIDIFPIDGIKEKQQAFESRRWRRLLNAKKASITGRSPLKNLSIMFTKILLLPFTTSYLIGKIQKVVTRNNYNDCEKVSSMCSQLAYKEIFDKEMFQEYAKVDFEGKKYNAPKDWDTYLKTNYNNYMQLPPKEKQVSNHTAKAMWKE